MADPLRKQGRRQSRAVSAFTSRGAIVPDGAHEVSSRVGRPVMAIKGVPKAQVPDGRDRPPAIGDPIRSDLYVIPIGANQVPKAKQEAPGWRLGYVDVQRTQIFVIRPDLKPSRCFHENANGGRQEGKVVDNQAAFDESPSVAMPAAENITRFVHDDGTDLDLGALISMNTALLNAMTAKRIKK
ncbi:hypothetical protein AB0O47_20200 [Streptomyces noursei]|uniref:hypothetical protein n=1 Tax=Streptomyces noursei TaxID=1971 RepID=UPI00344CD5EA